MKTQRVESLSGKIETRHSIPEHTGVSRAVPVTGPQGEEELIMDDRWNLRPAQIVEDKLANLLKGEFVMVSQLRLKSLIANRS